MSTGDYIALFLSSCKTKGLSELTIKWYSQILYRFCNQYSRLPKKPEPIENFLASCPGKDERKHGYYRTLRCFYRFLERRLGIKNPIKFIDPPKLSHKEPNTLNYIELNSLLSYPHESAIKSALLFLADTGARLGELYNLKPEDFKETPFGYIVRINGKTGDRTIPVGRGTAFSIVKHIPFPYTKHRLGRKISLAFDAAGITGTAHTLRHTSATLWDGSELVLQSIMGHSNMETLKRYRHLKMRILSVQHSMYTPISLAGPTALQVSMI